MTKFLSVLCCIVLTFIVIDILEPSYGFFGKVPTASVGVVTTFGKVKDEVLAPGFHVKGFFDKINSVSTRTQKYDMSTMAFSADIQQVDVSICVSYNIDEQSAPTLFVTVGNDYEAILIQPRLTENTKIVIARYSAEALVENRGILATEILELMQTDLSPYGITVTSISIEDIDFTDAFTAAVENKQVATQEKLTAETEQERLTMEAEEAAKRDIIAAETDAEKARIAAEADAEKARIIADADAHVIITRAQAEADANKLIAESLTPEILEMMKYESWNGALPQVTGGSNTVIPIDIE